LAGGVHSAFASTNEKAQAFDLSKATTAKKVSGDPQLLADRCRS
jgi:hypothetical protein